MTLIATILVLVTLTLASHWAVWRRLGDAEDAAKELRTRVEWCETCRETQAKQIVGLQTWCRNIDRREDELNAGKPVFPANYLATTYPKRPDEA